MRHLVDAIVVAPDRRLLRRVGVGMSGASLTNDQCDAIWDAYCDLRVMASAIAESALTMEKGDKTWILLQVHADRLCHFAVRQEKVVESLGTMLQIAKVWP